MSSLLKLDAERERMLLDLEENFGEIGEEEYDKLTQIENQIKAKADYYLTAISDKRYKNKIDELKSRKKEIDNAIKKLEQLEAFMQQQLHSFITENGGIIPFDKDGVRLYAKPNTSYRTEVDTSKLDKEERTYKIAISKLPEEDFLKLQHDLELEYNSPFYTFDLNVGVKDLPENHPALIKIETPTIKITKSK